MRRQSYTSPFPTSRYRENSRERDSAAAADRDASGRFRIHPGHKFMPARPVNLVSGGAQGRGSRVDQQKRAARGFELAIFSERHRNRRRRAVNATSVSGRAKDRPQGIAQRALCVMKGKPLW